VLLGVAVLAGIDAARAQVRLSANSPFLPGPSLANDAGGPPDEYQLAGATMSEKSAAVCIYDTVSRHSRWITVGTTEGGIQVLSYDSANDLATVKVNGTQKVLAQRKATVVARAVPFAPAPAPVVAAVMDPASQNNGAANQAPIVNPAEAGKSPEVVKQEKEARMLVSDLLEIGLQQRKAYEEAQKKAGNGP
jgi:hypothetical protein